MIMRHAGARAALVMAVAGAAIGTSGVASAEDEPRGLGAPGTVVLSGRGVASYSKGSTPDGGKMSSSSLGVSVAGDVFVARGFSLGLSGHVSYGKSTFARGDTDLGSYRTYRGGGALRVGYYLPLGERVGFWPIVSAGITRVAMHGNAVQDVDGHLKQVLVLAQFIVHVDRGWFLSVTPAIAAYSTSSDGLIQTDGGVPSLALGFGGYF